MTGAPDPNQEPRLHLGWWARLEGQTCDLEALAWALGDRSRVQVRQFDGRYYVRMAEFDQLDESGDVETRAGEVLRIVNGAARVEYGDNSEVRVDASARVQPNGQIQHLIHLSATLHSRARVLTTLTVNGESAPAARANHHRACGGSGLERSAGGARPANLRPRRRRLSRPVPRR